MIGVGGRAPFYFEPSILLPGLLLALLEPELILPKFLLAQISSPRLLARGSCRPTFRPLVFFTTTLDALLGAPLIPLLCSQLLSDSGPIPCWHA